ncbi:hypothetical protein ACFQ0X_20970 [Streptomyces rectiviolaceus]|uniref:hypothetical protein n=1 Tax=Streptomyces rectiviolaceus TaxID=332591 RepID=UPI0031E47E2B
MRHSIPDDLVQTQRTWMATYEQLAEQPGRTALRRRLLRLSRELASRPEARAPGARQELLRLVRQRSRS